MKLDINNYSEVLYVDTKGNDDSGNGSETNPYATIGYAISKITLDNTLIVIGSGKYTIESISSLTLINKTTNYIGKGKKTEIIVSKCVVNYANNSRLNVYSCLIKASDTFGGETRALMYSFKDSYQEVHYYNVLFSISDNGNYPTSGLMWHTNNYANFTNKYYHNCSFNDKTIGGYVGVAQYENCVTNMARFLTTVSDETAYAQYLINNVNSVTYDSNYGLTNEDNNLYGVYSGAYAWKFGGVIKMNGKYYSFKDSEYDSTTSMYKEIKDLTSDNLINYSDSFENLWKDVTIGSETFKPIDKFDEFRLVYEDGDIYCARGLKTNNELIIAKQSFSTKLAKNIDFFELISDISDTSSIKMVVSIDEGVTWKTWNGTEFVNLENICPLKEYSALSEEEKTQWNTFRDEVDTGGINAATLNTIDFNSIKSDNMMFAYVFNKDSYKDKCEMSKLQYQFDANGSYVLIGTGDVDIKQNSDFINITPKKKMDLMKINIGSSGEVNIIQNGGTADIDLPTDIEVDNMINEVMNNVFA